MKSVKDFGVSEIGNNWFGESWTRAPGPENITVLTFLVSQNETEKLLFQNEAKFLYGASGPSFLLKIWPAEPPQTPNPGFSPIFSRNYGGSV